MNARAWSLLALLLPAAAGAGVQVLPSDAPQVPVRLAVDRAIWQQPAGRDVTLQVSLRNAQGEPVPAASDTAVEVHTSLLDAPVRVVIPAGQSARAVTFPAATPGSSRIEITGPGLASASCVVVVTPADAPRVRISRDALLRPVGGARAPPPARPPVVARPPALSIPPEPEEPPKGASPTPPPPPPPPPTADELPSTGAGPSAPVDTTAGAAPPPTPRAPHALVPFIFVNPETVRPENGAWTALVKVGFLDDRQQLVQAANTFPVQFSARVGHLSDDVVTFKAGEYLSPPVKVVSSTDGVDSVSAVTPLGSARPVQVAYVLPAPTRLQLRVPQKVVNARGDSPARITVVLTTDAGVAAPFVDRDVTVSLSSTLGDLKDATLTIPRNHSDGSTVLTSVRDGRARVTATAPGFLPGEASVKFSFPVLLGFLAALGGVLGHYVMRPSQFMARGHVVRSVVTGVVVGLVFYAAVAFGALRGVGDVLPVDVSRIVTGNELGALLAGCVGGFAGVGIWKVATARKPHGKQPATT